MDTTAGWFYMRQARRIFERFAAVITTLCMPLVCCFTLACERPLDADAEVSRLPNIILITLDTTRRDHLGLYGYDRPTSPNLDRLAKDSIVYTKAYSTTS